MSVTKQLFNTEEWNAILEEMDIPPQQARVLKELVDCSSDKQIAAAMDIKIPTVRVYLSRLYARFDVQDRTSMVVYTFKVFRRLS